MLQSKIQYYTAHLSEIVLQKQNQFYKELESSQFSSASSSYPSHPPIITDVEQSIKSLLTLFKVQQHRVLSRVKDGGKAPQALEVAGSDIGSWHDLTSHIQHLGVDNDDDFDDANSNCNNSSGGGGVGGGGRGVSNVSTKETTENSTRTKEKEIRKATEATKASSSAANDGHS